MKNCTNKDILPSFLKFRIPKNEVFRNKLCTVFRLSSLRKEISRAEQNRRLVR